MTIKNMTQEQINTLLKDISTVQKLRSSALTTEDLAIDCLGLELQRELKRRRISLSTTKALVCGLLLIIVCIVVWYLPTKDSYDYYHNNPARGAFKDK